MIKKIILSILFLFIVLFAWDSFLADKQYVNIYQAAVIKFQDGSVIEVKEFEYLDRTVLVSNTGAMVLIK